MIKRLYIVKTTIIHYKLFPGYISEQKVCGALEMANTKLLVILVLAALIVATQVNNVLSDDEEDAVNEKGW